MENLRSEGNEINDAELIESLSCPHAPVSPVGRRPLRPITSCHGSVAPVLDNALTGSGAAFSRMAAENLRRASQYQPKVSVSVWPEWH
jgi:hypothetical protein